MKPILLDAWIPQYANLSTEQLAAPSEYVAGALAYTTPENDMAGHGWVKAGTAEIILHLNDPDTMLAGQIEALQLEKKKLQAEAQMRITQIEGKIQNLLAITYQPAAE